MKTTLWLAGALGAAVSFGASAGTPNNGTLSASAPHLTYTPGPFVGANQSGEAGDGPVCNAGLPCDSYKLTVVIAPDHQADRARVQISWPTDSLSDYDLYVYAGDVGDLDGLTPADAGESAGGANPEVVTFDVTPGTTVYTIKVVPYTPTPGEEVVATIDWLDGGGGGGGGGGDGTCTVPAGDRP